MKLPKITDVRIVPGDSGFLIDDGTTAILYDSGFGFTGEQMADRIQKELGNRKLNYIFLTHSHYDHALGSVAVAKRYPDAKIVAGSYTKTIFQKTSAKSIMRELDQKAAAQWDSGNDTDMTDGLRVDLAVEDGDILDCGTMHFTVIALPGHTKCSVGFYLQEHELLLGTETLGVYIDDETYLPSYLVGYHMTIASLDRTITLKPKHILVPHYGVLSRDAAIRYLLTSKQIAEKTAQWIQSHLQQGLSQEAILELLEERQYLSHVAPVYPLDAFRLNTSIMIRLIGKELLNL